MDEDLTQWPSRQDNSLSGDYGSLCIILFLYIIQGIPSGLSMAIPLILQSYKVTYSQQAIFSLANWPFSLKLLWAPVVDSLYNRRMGRRKSWVIPSQYLIGFVMFLLSLKIDDLLGPLPEETPIDNNRTIDIITPLPIGFNSGSVLTETPSVKILAAIFFLLNFLCATQDVAIDGWVLTMLSKPNVVYGSACNSIGQTIGISFGYHVFLALQSPDFCNKYLRSVPSDVGMITLKGYLYFWSIVFLITTTLVWIFKREKPEKANQSAEEETILGTYLMLIKILKLKSIQSFALILLTCKLAFAITDSGTPLKLTEAGISKETLAFLTVPLIPMQIILPWYLTRYTKGSKPLKIFIQSYPFRILCGILYALLLTWTKYVYDPTSKSFPGYYYFVVVLVLFYHRFVQDCTFVIFLAFFARISDPVIGGTYMTLLNTISNLGGNWPSFISLWILDYTTFKHCSVDEFSCNSKETLEACSVAGGQCNTTIDGYYVEVIFLTIIGLIWLKWARKRIEKIESLPPNSWRCSQDG